MGNIKKVMISVIVLILFVITIVPISIKALDDTQIITEKGEIFGDVVYNDNTGNKSIEESQVGRKIYFDTNIDAKPIKEKIMAIKNKYPNINEKDIKLSDTDFEINLVYTLPEYIVPLEDLRDSVYLDAHDDILKLDKIDIEGKQIKIKFNLSHKYDNFLELKNKINSFFNHGLCIVIDAFLNFEAKENILQTLKVEITTNFKTKTNYGNKNINFDYHWDVVQDPKGKDLTAKDDKTLQCTIRTESFELQISKKEELANDILIGDNTEHDEVFITRPGNIHDFTIKFNIKRIKDEVEKLKTFYKEPVDEEIEIRYLQSNFFAIFNLDEKLSFDIPLTKDNFKFINDNNIFVIKDIKVENKKLLVNFKIKDKFKDYEKLSKAIKSCDDNIVLIIPGIKVSNTAKHNQLLTVTNVISGDLRVVTAFDGAESPVLLADSDEEKNYSINSGSIDFRIHFESKQTIEGMDKIADPTSKVAQFTLKVIVPKEKIPAPKENKTTITPPEVSKNKRVPNTSDDSCTVTYILFMAIAIGILSVFSKKRYQN